MKKFPEYDIIEKRETGYDGREHVSFQLETDASEAPMGAVMADVKEKLGSVQKLIGITVYYAPEECILYVPYSDYGTHAWWRQPQPPKLNQKERRRQARAQRRAEAEKSK